MKHLTRAAKSLRAMLAEWRTKGLAPSSSAGASGKGCRERSPPRPALGSRSFVVERFAEIASDQHVRQSAYHAFSANEPL